MKENSIEEDIKLAEEEKKAIESFKQENENDLSRFEDFNDYTQTLIKRNKTILNLIQKQQAEIEKKDKIIDEMAARVYLNEEEREEMKKDIYNNVNHKGFADFVKRYFEMKVRKEND